MYLEISNPEDYSVALYIRLSKEDERDGPSQSVRNQHALLEEFVKKNKLMVVDTYIDDGFSGTNFERPNFQRMIADIEAKKVNMVITKDLSRLGRDYITVGHYMERYFPEQGVRYLSLLDGIDTAVESIANDITPFRSIMNDMYAKDISKKITSVKREKQRKGEFIGGKALYGYKKHPVEKNKIIIDEKAAFVVRRIFAMALSGMSCRKIAMVLNQEGVETPAAYCGWKRSSSSPYTGLWSSERISQMLQNETYIGNMVQGRRKKISYKSKKCIRQAPENWVVVQGTHEPIIDKAAFQQVQMLLNSRKYTRCRTYDFLLKGLIFCHECGYPMAVVNRKNAAGEDRLFFICRTYQRFARAGACTCHSMKEQTVTEAIRAKLKDMCQAYLNAEYLQPIAVEMIKKSDRDGSLDECRILQSKITAISEKLDHMYMDRLSGLLSEEDFMRIYQKTKRSRTALEEKWNRLRLQSARPDIAEEKAQALVKRFLDSAFASRELWVSLIERVELTEGKEVIVRFRFSDPSG